jgi:hypothetical protein
MLCHNRIKIALSLQSKFVSLPPCASAYFVNRRARPRGKGRKPGIEQAYGELTGVIWFEASCQPEGVFTQTWLL